MCVCVCVVSHEGRTSLLKRLAVAVSVKDDAYRLSDQSPRRERRREIRARASSVSYTPSTCSSAQSHTKSAVLPRKLAVLKTEQMLFHLRDGLICSEVYVSQ